MAPEWGTEAGRQQSGGCGVKVVGVGVLPNMGGIQAYLKDPRKQNAEKKELLSKSENQG